MWLERIENGSICFAKGDPYNRESVYIGSGIIHNNVGLVGLRQGLSGRGGQLREDLRRFAFESG